MSTTNTTHLSAVLSRCARVQYGSDYDESQCIGLIYNMKCSHTHVHTCITENYAHSLNASRTGHTAALNVQDHPAVSLRLLMLRLYKYEPSLVAVVYDALCWQQAATAPHMTFIPKIVMNFGDESMARCLPHAQCHRLCAVCKPCDGLCLLDVYVKSSFCTL